jgi:hypothetical protein
MNSKPNQGTDPKSKPTTSSQTSSLEVEFDGDSSGASSLGGLVENASRLFNFTIYNTQVIKCKF